MFTKLKNVNEINRFIVIYLLENENVSNIYINKHSLNINNSNYTLLQRDNDNYFKIDRYACCQ